MNREDRDQLAEILGQRPGFLSYFARHALAWIAAGAYLLVMVGVSSWQTATIHYLEQRLDRVQSSGVTS